MDSKKYIEIEINKCVHYCAFRYGRNEFNPYENYIQHLVKNGDVVGIQRNFVNFLLKYRPRNMGEAIGVTLSKEYPMWVYPWNSKSIKFVPRFISNIYTKLLFSRRNGWKDRLIDVPDILTHFSEKGIPADMIQREYEWLHGAYDSIKNNGYLPEIYGVPVGRILSDCEGNISCLMLDGNHRISALSALGYKKLVIEYCERDTIYLNDLEQWPLVANGIYTLDDARMVFEAYYKGNTNYVIGDPTEKIVEQ